MSMWGPSQLHMSTQRAPPIQLVLILRIRLQAQIALSMQLGTQWHQTHLVVWITTQTTPTSSQMQRAFVNVQGTALGRSLYVHVSDASMPRVRLLAKHTLIVMPRPI